MSKNRRGAVELSMAVTPPHDTRTLCAVGHTSAKSVVQGAGLFLFFCCCCCCLWFCLGLFCCLWFCLGLFCCSLVCAAACVDVVSVCACVCASAKSVGDGVGSFILTSCLCCVLACDLGEGGERVDIFLVCVYVCVCE
jgi:hypothetical protein